MPSWVSRYPIWRIVDYVHPHADEYRLRMTMANMMPDFSSLNKNDGTFVPLSLFAVCQRGLPGVVPADPAFRAELVARVARARGALP